MTKAIVTNKIVLIIPKTLSDAFSRKARLCLLLADIWIPPIQAMDTPALENADLGRLAGDCIYNHQNDDVYHVVE